MPLNVTIVGSGIGGLSAAICLRQNGHNVTLYEQSRFASETGAAIHLCPNSNGLLRHMGVLPEQFGGVTMKSMMEYNEKGIEMRYVDLVEPNKIWQHPWQLVHRVRLHDTLKKAATSEGLPGKPAKLCLSSRVTEVDPETATIILDNGNTITADVVLGADGIYSRTRTSVLGRTNHIFSSGKAAFRFLIPRSAVLDDPVTAGVFQKDSELYIWYGEDRRVVVYPCDNNELLNFVCIHPEEESQGSIQEWNKEASIDQILNVYQNFDHRLLAAFCKADPASLKVWKLLDMEQMPTWIKQRLALLGDAAHPFLPHQGQGGGVAIEDAVALMAVFPPETLPEDVPDRLKLYESIRYKRAHAIQEYSRQAGKDLKDGKQQLDMMKYLAYNFGHDEWHNSTNIFRKWQRTKNLTLNSTIPELSYSTAALLCSPSGFPVPSPDQNFKTVSVTVKSSRTFLKTLFPTEKFSFKGPGTVAHVTFAATTVNNVKSLCGGAFTHFGLYIHDVQYGKGGEGGGSDANDNNRSPPVEGTFIPLLFQDIADSIITRRPEFSMTTLQCTFNSEHSASGYQISASWKGTKFALISVSGLREEQADEKISCATATKKINSRLLMYRCDSLPGFGMNNDNSSASDTGFGCDYPISVESMPATPPSEVSTTKILVAKASQSTVAFYKRDQTTLPTLYGYLSILAEIPIYEVLEAKVIEGTGSAGDSVVQRIG